MWKKILPSFIFLILTVFCTFLVSQTLPYEEYEKALNYYNVGDLQTAKLYLKNIIEKNPYFTKAYELFADILEIEGKYEEALEVLDSAIKIDPKNKSLNFKKLELLTEIGKYNEFLEEYNKLKKLFPEEVELDFIYAKYLVKQGKLLTALDMLEKLKVVLPQAYKVYLEIGKIYYELKDFQNALKALQKAYELGYYDYNVNYYLGLVYKEMKQYEKSVEYLKSSIKANPYLQEAYDNLLQIYYAKNDIENISNTLETMIKYFPQNPFTVYNLSQIYLNSNPEKAITLMWNNVLKTTNSFIMVMLEEMISQIPQKPTKIVEGIKNIRRSMFYTYTKRYLPTLALFSLTRILVIDPNDVEARKELASMYYRKNMVVPAFLHYKILANLYRKNGKRDIDIENLVDALNTKIYDDSLEAQENLDPYKLLTERKPTIVLFLPKYQGKDVALNIEKNIQNTIEKLPKLTENYEIVSLPTNYLTYIEYISDIKQYNAIFGIVPTIQNKELILSFLLPATPVTYTNISISMRLYDKNFENSIASIVETLSQKIPPIFKVVKFKTRDSFIANIPKSFVSTINTNQFFILPYSYYEKAVKDYLIKGRIEVNKKDIKGIGEIYTSSFESSQVNLIEGSFDLGDILIPSSVVAVR